MAFASAAKSCRFRISRLRCRAASCRDPALHLAPHGRRLEPQRLVAVEHGAKPRNPQFGAPARARRLAAIEHAMRAEAAAAQQTAIKQSKHPRLDAAAVADK